MEGAALPGAGPPVPGAGVGNESPSRQLGEGLYPLPSDLQASSSAHQRSDSQSKDLSRFPLSSIPTPALGVNLLPVEVGPFTGLREKLSRAHTWEIVAWPGLFGWRQKAAPVSHSLFTRQGKSPASSLARPKQRPAGVHSFCFILELGPALTGVVV